MSRFSPSFFNVLQERGVYLKDPGFGAKFDGTTDDTAAWTQAINFLGSSGGVILLANGTSLVDFSKLPAQTQNIIFVGTYSSVIKITNCGKVNSAAPYFTACKFENITFTYPTAGTGDGPFITNCADLKFIDCTIKDFVSGFITGALKNIAVLNCKWRNSSGFTSMAGFIGNVLQGGLLVEDCDFNYAPNNAGGANSVIALNWSGGMSGPVWIKNNRFFDWNQTGFYTDCAVDIEPGGTTPLDNVCIDGNVIYNSKVYISAVTTCFVRSNKFRTTSVLSGNTGADWPVVVKTTNNTIACGLIEIADNDFIEDDGAYNYQAQPINVEPSSTIDHIYIHDNRIQVNGHATASPYSYPWTPITINQDETNAAVIDKVTINDNIISFTAVPTTKPNIVSMNAQHAAINRVYMKGNRVGGVSSAGNHFFDIQFGSGISGLAELFIEDNDILEAGLASSFLGNTGSPVKWRITNNKGYNPIGTLSPYQPAMPASGTAYKNPQPAPCRVYVSGGTVSQIAVNGESVLITSGTVLLDVGDTITLTYTAAPSWIWHAL